MKVKITYQRGEERFANAIQALVRGMFPDAKVHDSDRYAPFFHKYLTTTKSENDFKKGRN